MTDAAAILRSFGLGLADELVQAAALEHVDLAVAATILAKESGGRNVWGSDGVSTGGTYVKGSTVTQSAYLAYRTAVHAGRIGRQGVGPMQCTSASYQDQADLLGGCWVPLANMRSGLRGLGNLIRAYGIRDGARRYNGSGPAAEAYARDFMAKYAIWKSRLSGASVPPPLQEVDLSAQFETDARKRWPEEDQLDKDLRGDLAFKQRQLDGLVTAVHVLTAKVDALAASVAGLAARNV